MILRGSGYVPGCCDQGEIVIQKGDVVAGFACGAKQIPSSILELIEIADSVLEQHFSKEARQVGSMRNCISAPGDRFEDAVVFYVHGWTGEAPRLLQGVSVWMVGREGAIRNLGKTDVFGGSTLEKEEVLKGVVLGFSSEGYLDGVWRVDSEELRSFDELHVGLAPLQCFEIRSSRRQDGTVFGNTRLNDEEWRSCL